MTTPTQTKTENAAAAAVFDEFMHAFAEERIDDMFALLADDVEWLDHSTDASGLRGRAEGKEDLISGPLADFDRLIELHAMPVGPTAAAGDIAFNLFQLDYTVRDNGRRYEGPFVAVGHVADGRIDRIEFFSSEPESLYV